MLWSVRICLDMDSLLLFSLMVGDYEHDEIIEMAYYSVLNGLETFCSDSDVIT